MPELPEVETIRRDLARVSQGRRFKAVEFLDKRVLKQTPKSRWQKLVDQKIKDWRRIGKLLIVEFDSLSLFLLIHLKMTGQLIYQSKHQLIPGGHNLPDITASLPNKYTVAVFALTGGGKIFFNDMRRFGYVRLATRAEFEKITENFGPDVMTADFSLSYWLNIAKDRKAPIKNLLMNQKLLAGIGNIYADEVCFRAKVRPTRPANSLTKQELMVIFKAIKQIMPLAIKYRGTTFSDYVDGKGKKGGFVRFLKVYGLSGKKCKRCRQGVIKKIKLGGRGTHFCLHCQF